MSITEVDTASVALAQNLIDSPRGRALRALHGSAAPVLFDTTTAEGGVGASVFGTGTAMGDRIEADLHGDLNTVYILSSAGAGTVTVAAPAADQEWAYPGPSYRHTTSTTPGLHAVAFDVAFTTPFTGGLVPFVEAAHWGELRALFATGDGDG